MRALNHVLTLTTTGRNSQFATQFVAAENVLASGNALATKFNARLHGGF
jgi:hypothetical protein